MSAPLPHEEFVDPSETTWSDLSVPVPWLSIVLSPLFEICRWRPARPRYGVSGEEEDFVGHHPSVWVRQTKEPEDLAILAISEPMKGFESGAEQHPPEPNYRP